MANSLIAIDQYRIEQQLNENGHIYTLFRGEAVIAKADNAAYVLEAMHNDYAAKRQTLIERVANPVIKITFSVR